MPQELVKAFEQPLILMVLEARLIFKHFFIAKKLIYCTLLLGEIA
jgi:hypothetical protein